MTRLIRLLCAVVILFVPFHLLIRVAVTAEPAAYWKEALLGLAVMATLLTHVSGVPRRLLQGVPLVPLTLFVAIGALWTFARGDRSALFGFAGYTTYMALFVMVLLAFERRHVAGLARMLLLAGTIVAIGGAIQVLGSPTLFGLTYAYQLEGTDQTRVTSILASSILLGPYMAMLIVLAVGYALASPLMRTRVLLFALAGVMLFTLINTWSRGGWLQLIVTLALYVAIVAFLSPGRSSSLLMRRLLLTAVGAIVALPVLLVLFDVRIDVAVLLDRALSAFDWSGDRGNTLRLQTWAATWDFIGRNPGGLLIGTGPGEGWFFSSIGGYGETRYAAWMAANGLPAVTESLWLLLVLNYGLVGLGLFVALYAGMLLYALRALPAVEDRGEFLFRAALVANLGGMFIAFTWLQSLTSLYIAMLVWVQFAMLLILTRDEDDIHDAPSGDVHP